MGLLQFSSVTQSCLTLCNTIDFSMPGLPVRHQLPEFTQTHESVIPSNHLILCCPLLFLPSVFPRIRVFSIESMFHIRRPKYWSFSISPYNESSGLIFFSIGSFDFLAIQETLENLLQHHSSKASVLLCWAFFMIQLSYLYIHIRQKVKRSWGPRG